MGIVVFACKELGSIDPSKDLKLILNFKPADSFVEAQIKDAVSGTLISSNINIEILGAQAANVINFEGEAKSKYTKKGPSFYIGFQKIFPTLANPIKLKILISADGYLSNSRDLVLTSSENPPISIALVKINTPPVGSAIKQGNVSVTASGASQATTLEVVNEQKATVLAINQGTVMNDSKGNAVTGNLTSTVATFSGNSRKAAGSFPGGSNSAVLAKDVNGNTNVAAILEPIAFADITIKSSSGAEVTNFSKPIDISFEIDQNTINPTTQKTVQEGDSFSIYSYSNAVAAWTYDKEGTVISKNGKLFVSFGSNHLSWFFIGKKSSPPTPTVISLKLNTEIKSLNYRAIVTTSTGEVEFFGVFSASTPGDFTSTISLPANIKSMVIYYQLPGMILVGEIPVPNPNASQIVLEGPKVTTTFPKKTVIITVSCENKCALEIYPSNVGIQYNTNTQATAFADSWNFAGNVNTDPADNKIKLVTYLPNSTDVLFRAIAYPEYAQKVNTGAGASLDAEIKLPNTHPLCKCGK